MDVERKINEGPCLTNHQTDVPINHRTGHQPNGPMNNPQTTDENNTVGASCFVLVQVYLNKGYNTDGKAWSTPASTEGLEGLDYDSSPTLYDAVVECRVIKTPQEIEMMQHITDLSSEAHFEVR